MRLALLATCLLMLIAAPGLALAQAGDPILPPPDPPGVWRKLTREDASTSSTCIGNPVTPLCAVETYWACFIRRQPELCDMVEAGVRPLPEVTWSSDRRQDYRVVYARRPSPLDPVDRATEGDMKPQPGDVVLGLMRRTCYGPADSDADCEIGVETEPPHVHMLRRQGNLWVYAYRFRARF
jgi:hypothetical protein